MPRPIGSKGCLADAAVRWCMTLCLRRSPGHLPAVTGDDGDGLEESEAADGTTFEGVLVRGEPVPVMRIRLTVS